MRRTSSAMIITEYKENEDGHKYIQKHKVQFDVNKVNEYKRHFKELESKGIVDEGTFESNEWAILNNKEDRRRAKFVFRFEMHHNFQMALKAFVLFMINIKKQDVNTLDNYLNHISHIAYITNMFSKDKLDELKNYYQQYKIDNDGMTKSLFQNKIPLLRFVNFINLPHGDEYVNLIEREFAGYKYKKGIRDLPPFEDLIIFGVIVKEFFNNTDNAYQELRDKYAIVKVWWELTTIIPMRVGEFIRLKVDALSYDEDSRKYYLKIPRIKRNFRHANEVINIEEYEIQTLEVTEEIANLFNYYITKYGNQEKEFLFTNYNKKAKPKKINMSNIGASGCAIAVNGFITDVVKGIYRHDILRKVKFKNPEDRCNKMIAIQPGDTRHIAIGNMIEMGVNPLIISKMAFHSDINAQISYAMYITREAEIKSKSLAEQLSGYYERASMIIDSNLDIINDFEINNDRAALVLRKGQGIKIKHGVCTSEYGPFNCMENSCYFCKSFIPVINNKNRTEIKAIVDKFRNEIYEKLNVIQESILELLQEVSKKAIKQEDGTFTSDQKLVEELQTQYNKTVNLKNRLVVVEAINYLEQKLGDGKEG